MRSSTKEKLLQAEQLKEIKVLKLLTKIFQEMYRHSRLQISILLHASLTLDNTIILSMHNLFQSSATKCN